MATTSIPLADYFWVAGLDSITYDDAPLQNNNNGNHQVDATIAEDGESDHDNANGTSLAHSSSRSTSAARHSRHNSGNRLSRFSFDPRLSFSTLDELESSNGNTVSNRSSTTIKAPTSPTTAPHSNGTNGNANGTSVPEIVTDDPSNSGPGGAAPGALGGISDFDFDKALVKFAAERENFLDDLSFTAGAKTQAQKPMVNPRAERIKADEESGGRISPLRSLQGSIRRKISFREMKSSVRKGPPSGRPSSMQRAG